MERHSELSARGRVRSGRIGALLLAACFSLALASCSSSSSSPAVDANVNQHLAYQHLLGDDDTLKPHQTTVLNLASRADDHLNVGNGSGYHNLPYEITNAGTYKYCIPDEDTHLTQIELFTQAGALAGSWKKGEACAAVPLSPGRYAMHVHLDTTESDPVIFLKPHNVTVTQAGTAKGTRKRVVSYSGQIPGNQFLSLNVDALTDVLQWNNNKGLNEGWGVGTVGDTKYNEFYGPLNTYLNGAAQLTSRGLLYFAQQEQDKVTIFQGDNNQYGDCIISWSVPTHNRSSSKTYQIVANRSSCSIPSVDVYGRTGISMTYETLFGFFPSSQLQLNHYFGLSSFDNQAHFVGWEYGASVVYSSGQPFAGPSNDPVGLTHSLSFIVKVRYGTTKGLVYPAILANEVALFDRSWTSSGFPDSTHYWIFNTDMLNFNEFAFDNPDQRIKTVIAGRGVRAQLFQNPSFQGDSFYVSPPADGELLMTDTDNALLSKGTIGSIRIEANTNDITKYEYEHTIVASAKTCIDCDLRGFDLFKMFPDIRGTVTVSGLNFTDSDLSNAQIIRYDGVISDSDFTRTNFTDAQFQGITFKGCNLAGTDFTRANLQSVIFDARNSKYSFLNGCPKLESTDLTKVQNFIYAFDVPDLNAITTKAWWDNNGCRTSIANSTVNATLFVDQRFWQYLDAPGVDFSNMKLDNAVFAGSNLAGAKFNNSSLKRAVFTRANLTGADLTGADLTGAHIEGATLTGSILSDTTKLTGAYLSGVSTNPLSFSSVDMSYAILTKGSYTNWDTHSFPEFAAASFKGAIMAKANLNNADVSGVDFSGADLGSATFDIAVARSANFNGANLTSASFKIATLSSSSDPKDYYTKAATFSGAILEGTDFSSALLSTADFSNAGFSSGTNFTDAVLDGAKFNGAWLAEVNFSQNPPRSMRGVSFYQAYLMKANLTSCNMSPILTTNNNTPSSFFGAYLQGAILDSADLTAANLTQALLSFTSGSISKPRPWWDSTTKQVKLKNDNVSYNATTGSGSVTTTHDTTCPDGSSGPCTTRAQWTYTPPNNDGPVINPDL